MHGVRAVRIQCMGIRPKRFNQLQRQSELVLKDAQVEWAPVLGADDVQVDLVAAEEQIDDFLVVRSEGKADRGCPLGVPSVEVDVLAHLRRRRQLAFLTLVLLFLMSNLTDILEQVDMAVDTDLVNQVALLRAE